MYPVISCLLTAVAVEITSCVSTRAKAGRTQLTGGLSWASPSLTSFRAYSPGRESLEPQLLVMFYLCDQ